MYDAIREKYRPSHIKMLLIAESPPPAANIRSSRHFYRSEKIRTGDRLFTNTMRALYPDADEASEQELQEHKEEWLRRFQADGWYMIEALHESLAHNVTKRQRQEYIEQQLPNLIKKVQSLIEPDTKIILIKSNVFQVAAAPLKQAGFTILNTELVDYPGQFNQKSYRSKLAELVKK